MNDSYYLIIPLLIGFILDSLIGDPYWFPHPIRFFGNTIAFFENLLNNKRHKKLKGVVLTISLVLTTWSLLYGLQILINPSKYLYYSFISIMVFYGIANRNLIDEAIKVNKKLTKYGIVEGRKQLSNIVGRDTSNLSENQVRIATLETLSENLSDGVIAPLFYYMIGGVPLMFSYKMINTLDSMIGYKSSRYKDFGCFPARLDDVVNFIPSRITALFMVLITFSKRGFFFIIKYGHKHSSPNSGYPESALAGILNCQFGGPNVYHCQMIEKPFIGNNNRYITSKDIYKACSINYLSSLAFISIYFLMKRFLF